ncbi:type 4a pilus biogenesis protein PilO [Desulfurobacterium thermolithotrophum]|uniref:type 4a pilus biogenesis protein PilO n=1 Tax=Desulfurobacterium thermolithotrophum TaxID=64160 RepID=UPI0013D4AF91|nr:type 4a pilus biogenesis protein PilO [Desulfurobacterium thermolithotrophum]
MESLINFYEKWLEIPRWQRWFIIIILAAFLLWVLYFLRIIPLKEQLLTEKRKLESLESTVNRLKIAKKRKDKLEREITTLRKELSIIESKLPTGKEEVSKIIRSISDADSGVTIVSIQRKPPINKKYYVEIPYKIELKGTYPQFIHWCENLSKANRILNFGNFSINSIDNLEKEKKKTKYTVNVNLEIKAFSLKR